MASGRDQIKSTEPPSLRSGRLGLSRCYQPANDSCFQAHGVDVVAIHDFSPHLSDGTASWVADNGVSWVQDLLPSDMPNARIWTFNYRSDENTRLEPLAVELIACINLDIGHTPNGGRPIVFVGLGFGGIIIKRALLREREDKSAQSLASLTRGIVFLGTRHFGLTWDFLTTQKLKANVTKQIRKLVTFVEDPQIDATNRHFLNRRHKYHIACCAAKRSMAMARTLVFPVPQDVATYQESEIIYRDVSQNDLGRFNASDDHEYRQVLAFIMRHESEAPSRSLSQARLGDPSRDTPPIQPIREMKLLCLDGGGIRGLSSLLILRELMFSLQKKQNLKDLPRPCEQFDLICGTSTGGLIAIMLGRLRMDVTSCIVAYRKLARDIFKLNNPEKFAKGTWNWARGNGMFSAEALERAITEILKDRIPIAELTETRGLAEEASLRDPLPDSCKTFVCAVNADNHDSVRLRSFEVASVDHKENLSACKIIEAARATAAAPTYFPVAPIGSSKFYDGALRNNNPVMEMIGEVGSNLGNLPIQCLVSIGTGTKNRDTFKPGMVRTIKAVTSLATDTEENHTRIMRDGMYGYLRPKYLRFNVEGLGKLGLSDWKKLPYIESETRKYLGEQLTREDLGRGTDLMTPTDARDTAEE